MTEENEATQNNGSAGDTSFEGQLEQLEDIVAQLEQGDIPLDDALELYEQGVSAYRECHQKLETAESKVVKLVETLEGELEEEDFDVPDQQQ